MHDVIRGMKGIRFRSSSSQSQPKTWKNYFRTMGLGVGILAIMAYFYKEMRSIWFLAIAFIVLTVSFVMPHFRSNQNQDGR